jgi:TonB family protein
MKKISTLLPLFFVIFLANAQKKQNTYFFKNNGKEVELKDSADFIRIIQEPDSGETNYVVQEFYTNGNRKLIGKVSYFEPNLVYEGVVVSFNDKGKKNQSITYEQGNKVGMAFYFFDNGVIHKQVEYLPFKVMSNQVIGSSSNLVDLFADGNSKLIYQADSLGKVLVKDGNGHLIEIAKIGDDYLMQEGNYKDGLKEGLWKGNYISRKYSFEEQYEANKLISGTSTVEGKTYTYITLMQPPQFKAGINEFYGYLGRSVKYPIDAAKANITGTVILSFTIEKDGTPTNIEIKKSVHPSLDEEAKRVLRYSPKWIPATQRGLPVSVKYTIPIKFNIGR